MWSPACRNRSWRFPAAAPCPGVWSTSTPSTTSPSWPWTACRSAPAAAQLRPARRQPGRVRRLPPRRPVPVQTGHRAGHRHGAGAGHLRQQPVAGGRLPARRGRPAGELRRTAADHRRPGGRRDLCKATSDASLGFAITMTDLTPVARRRQPGGRFLRPVHPEVADFLASPAAGNTPARAIPGSGRGPVMATGRPSCSSRNVRGAGPCPFQGPPGAVRLEDYVRPRWRTSGSPGPRRDRADGAPGIARGPRRPR